MKRIGIVVQRFPVASETFIVRKVLGLLDRGFDVEIFAVTSSKSWDNFESLRNRGDIRKRLHVSVFDHKNNRVRFLMKSAMLLISSFIGNPREFIRLLRHLYRVKNEVSTSFGQQLLLKIPFLGRKLDILHIEFDAQAYGIADIKSFLNCKLVLSCRGTLKRTSVLQRYPNFYKHLFPLVDHYHFISNYLLEEVTREGLDTSVPVSLIEPAIDLTKFVRKQNMRNDNVFRLITLARLSWAKGYEFAIDALAMVRHEIEETKLEYLIVGDGPYKEPLVFAAHQHDLLRDGTVQFIGEVNGERVIDLLNSADLMIHPALEEGFCNAVIEGQAMEVTVVCTDAGGLPENVESGTTGFVVPRRDARAMAQKIIMLVRDADLRGKLGKAGRERALRKYSLTNQIDQFEKLYNSL